jgi:hypothetical protein
MEKSHAGAPVDRFDGRGVWQLAITIPISASGLGETRPARLA